MKEKTKRDELVERWLQVLRDKSDYESKSRSKGERVSHPTLLDISREIEAFFIGLDEKI